MAKRTVVSEAKIQANKLVELKKALIAAASKGDSEGCVSISAQIKSLEARSATNPANGLSPAERFVIKSLELAKADPEYQKNGWKGLAVNISPIPGKGFTINQGLRDLCGLKTSEDRIQLTEGMVRKGLIEKVPFRYYTRSGQAKGSVRLYLADDAPVRADAVIEDTTLEEFLGS